MSKTSSALYGLNTKSIMRTSGSNQIVTYTNSGLTIGTSQFCLEMIVKLTSTPGTYGTGLFGNAASSGIGLYCFINNSLIVYAVQNNNLTANETTAEGLVSLNTAVHIAVVRGSPTTAHTLYVNGRYKGSFGSTTRSWGSSWFLGKCYTDTSVSMNGNGSTGLDILYTRLSKGSPVYSGTSSTTANFTVPTSLSLESSSGTNIAAVTASNVIIFNQPSPLYDVYASKSTIGGASTTSVAVSGMLNKAYV